MHAGAIHAHAVHGVAVVRKAAKHGAFLGPAEKSGSHQRRWQGQKCAHEQHGIRAAHYIHRAASLKERRNTGVYIPRVLLTENLIPET